MSAYLPTFPNAEGDAPAPPVDLSHNGRKEEAMSQRGLPRCEAAPSRAPDLEPGNQSQKVNEAQRTAIEAGG